MEDVRGEPLAVRLRRGPLSVAEALDLGGQLADALAEAHAHGTLHCDLKPANVIVMPNGRAKILDFGLAQRFTSATAETTSGTPGLSLPAPKGIAGTPGYIAPERLAGRPLDARSDIYSLGVVLFELLTGRLPFPGPDIFSTALGALTQPVPDPSTINPGVPAAVGRAVQRALARDPAERFPVGGRVRRRAETARGRRRPR